MRKRTHQLLAAFLLASLLSACGVNATKTSKSTSTVTLSSASVSTSQASSFYVAQFSPAGGTVSAQPTTIQVQFSSTAASYAEASLASNYTMSCGGTSSVASSVSFSSGSYYATVTFPALAFAAGSYCSFLISSAIYDAYGNYLTGTRQADYYVTAASGSFSWTQASSVSYTGTAGGNGGSHFNDAGASSLALQGLYLGVGTYINGIEGLWASSDGTISYGPVHGTLSAVTALSCPSGYRVTGIFGYYGTLVNSVGITCKDASQSLSQQSQLAGVASGTYFSLSCPAGQFATNLYGRAGSLVDQLGLGCR